MYILKAQIYIFEMIGEVMSVFESALAAALLGVMFARQVQTLMDMLLLFNSISANVTLLHVVCNRP